MKVSRKSLSVAFTCLLIGTGAICWYRQQVLAANEAGSEKVFGNTERHSRETTNFMPFSVEWTEPLVNDYIYSTYVKPVTKGLIWEVRVDGETNKTYTLPPIDAPGDNTLNINATWSTLEWRIKPGQAKTVGVLMVVRKPRVHW